MKNKDLTKGSISLELFLLALPLVVSNLVNIAYNLVDVFFVGKVGPEALNAVGTAGLFIWLAQSCAFFSKQGMEILISQSLGRKDSVKADHNASNGLLLAFVFSAIFALITFFFARPLVEIFPFEDSLTIQLTIDYLKIASGAIFFMMINLSFMSIFQASGRTLIVLIYNGLGLAINIILDWYFIEILEAGVKGAAYATLIANFVVFILSFLTVIFFTKIIHNFFKSFSARIASRILALSFPSGSYQVFFTLTAIFISQFAVSYGDNVMAAQRVGNQVESFAWMIGIGLSIAISVFVGQNVGAQNYSRVLKGYTYMFIFAAVYGVIFSLVLFFWSENVVSIFTTDPIILEIGSTYFRIVAASQVFMIFEGITGGFFNGFGKTLYASFFSISGNLLRIGLVLILSATIGLDGIWWAISLSSIYKGGGLLIAFLIFTKKNHLLKNAHFENKNQELI